MMRYFVDFRGKTYNLHQLAAGFGLSYSICLRYYQHGYRDEELVRAVRQHMNDREIVFAGETFPTAYAAARKYHIPAATFYRYRNSGKLDMLEKMRKNDDEHNLS